MNLQVKMRLNKDQMITAQFTGKDLLECFHNANALLSHNGKCYNCEKDQFEITSREANGNLFAEFVCKD